MTAETADLERELRRMLNQRMDGFENALEALRTEQKSQGNTLSEIAANTSPLPELHRRIRSLEWFRAYILGAGAVVGLIVGAVKLFWAGR